MRRAGTRWARLWARPGTARFPCSWSDFQVAPGSASSEEALDVIVSCNFNQFFVEHPRRPPAQRADARIVQAVADVLANAIGHGHEGFGLGAVQDAGKLAQHLDVRQLDIA